MTRAMKVGMAIAALVGLAIGGGEGIYQTRWLGGATEFVEVHSISSAFSDFAVQQFKYADTAHAREAVLLQISVLQRLEPIDHDFHIGAELGWAYTRLGMIEELAGQKEAARAALDQARAHFKLLQPHEELTDDQMKNTVKLMDDAWDRVRLQ